MARVLTAAQVRAAFAPIPNLRRLFLRKAGTGAHHLAPLDGLRALALLWVIFCHAGWYAWFVLPLETYGELLFAPWMLFFWRGDFAVDGVEYHDIMAYPPGVALLYFSNPAITAPAPAPTGSPERSSPTTSRSGPRASPSVRTESCSS